MRSVKRLVPSERDDIGDLKTTRAMPTGNLSMIDPFLFLNHHGPQIYKINNTGLPFGPHPHRGFETVTFILEGDIAHRDSAGHESVISAGGVQWMTAGSGLIHEEISSAEFKQKGGPLEILQLWVNLPSRLKMTKPRYIGKQKSEIKSFEEGAARIDLIAGTWAQHQGSFTPLLDLTVALISIPGEGILDFEVPLEHNIFFYVITGSVVVNGTTAAEMSTVEFLNDGKNLSIKSNLNSKILLCHAMPLKEPVVSYGPFVMNTKEEIQQAIRDYQSGKMN